MRTRDPSSPSHATLRGDTWEEDSVQGGLCAGPALPLAQEPVEGLRPKFGRNRWSHVVLGARETGCGSVGGHRATALADGGLQQLSEGSPASKARTPLPPPPEAPEAPVFPDRHRPASENPAPWRPRGLRWAFSRLCLQSTGNGTGRWEQALWGGPSRGVIRAGCHCHLSSVGASPSGGIVVPK